MTTVIFNWVAYELAGLWPMIWSYGIGVGLLICCGLGFYFSPIHRTDFLWAALVVVVVMVSTSIGVSLGEKRVQAQWDVARAATLQSTKKARADGIRDVARKPRRFLPDHRVDPYLRD